MRLLGSTTGHSLCDQKAVCALSDAIQPAIRIQAAEILALFQRTYVQQMGFQHSAWTNEQWITKLATLPKTKKRAKNEWHFQSQT